MRFTGFRIIGPEQADETFEVAQRFAVLLRNPYVTQLRMVCIELNIIAKQRGAV